MDDLASFRSSRVVATSFLTSLPANLQAFSPEDLEPLNPTSEVGIPGRTGPVRLVTGWKLRGVGPPPRPAHDGCFGSVDGVEFTEALRRRKMVRSFSGRPVPRPILDRLLDGALRTPSAGNTGGWDAVVLEGPAETAVLWEATTTPPWRAGSRRWPGLEKAPVAVVLFAHPDAYAARYAEPDKEASGLGEGSSDPWPVPYWFVDTGFAALLLLLGAVDAGLGACFLGNFRGEDALAAALGVPPDRRYLGTVLLGEPGADDPPSASLARGRRRAEDVVHWRRW